MPDAGGSKPVQYISYKEYALISLDYNYQQYRCLLKLYGKESAWKPDAVNGSHYGIPQGKSEWLKDQDGYTQVRWGLSYIGNRYGEPCVALDHWSKYGWH
jgi:peptidoglycan DL-endopeptidase CwlO